MPNMTRYVPPTEFRSLQHQMNRLFEPFLGRALNDEDLVSGTWVPPVDVVEESDSIVVTAEVPGIKQENIDVQYENGVLTIRGTREFQDENKEKTYHRVERVYGQFVRSFTLPRSINPEKISAHYDNGVLEIRVPKLEEAKPKQIRIGVK